MTVLTSATLANGQLTLVSDLPATVVIPEAVFYDRGHRSLSSYVKRRLGLGTGGKYLKSMQMWVSTFVHLETIVPNVVGLTLEEATKVLWANSVELGTVTNETDPVTAQSPVADTVVTAFSNVDLTLTV